MVISSELTRMILPFSDRFLLSQVLHMSLTFSNFGITGLDITLYYGSGKNHNGNLFCQNKITHIYAFIIGLYKCLLVLHINLEIRRQSLKGFSKNIDFLKCLLLLLRNTALFLKYLEQ